MKQLELIEGAAERILAHGPDPAVRYRLLRDVLLRSPGDPEVIQARKALDGSRWVRLLAAEQHADGGWGKFHTRNYQSKQKTGTTQGGVERAVALGLDADHPVLGKAAQYITGILEGRIEFPDRAEKNDCWETGSAMFAGAKLAQIQPDLPVLDGVWDLWAAITRRSFSKGEHDLDAELGAHRSLTGRSGRCGWLRLNNIFAVTLIGSRARQLPKPVEKAYVQWLWERPRGLIYLDAPFRRPPQRGKFALDAWFTSMELLSFFPSWRRLAGSAVAWLWKRQNRQGLWDFGPRSICSLWFPLSESWRKRMSRQYDYSTRALALLRRYYGPV